ncbi:hypothetical protein, partial [Comamonas thiooxydans]|uniref:hypothetical protein n=1 Tax=Comamonas thiooxydans TaxID=363952 RepID=UPI001C0EC943
GRLHRETGPVGGLIISFGTKKSRLERRLFLEPVRDYWLARSRWNSRASWMNSIRELIAWRMMSFL